ncbi:helix-turn-helix domain-containing protein [Thermaerobacter subterraneus]|uniref:helix-turn-helix domain-containing protein n=1 Tax=Thermaerobacter subterraneus TaxID=175696 RepID=UPI0012EA5364|nr:ImmA/IrrE family metallo-endopeptidase [Thermaerobacter subterraneus]
MARAVGVTPERALAWLEGRARPTYRQARQIARRLDVSLGQLLLPPPERVTLPVADFRRGRLAMDEPSPALLTILYDALRKQDWWHEVHRGRHLDFVGSFNWRQARPTDVAEAIRKVIPVQQEQRQARDWGDFLSRLAAAAEKAGILVLRRGILGYNTHRPLDPEDFAGFALADLTAPLIFINTRDYVARRNFTFAHELVHIWLGQSGVDDNLELETPTDVEKFCDRAAAELLVPEEDFRHVWASASGDPHKVAEHCSRVFCVSLWVVARRALELGLIARDEYRDLMERYQTALRRRRSENRGGNPFRNIEVYNSPTFTSEVIDATLRGELGYGQAASLLGLKISTFVAYLERRI